MPLNKVQSIFWFHQTSLTFSFCSRFLWYILSSYLFSALWFVRVPQSFLDFPDLDTFEEHWWGILQNDSWVCWMFLMIRLRLCIIRKDTTGMTGPSQGILEVLWSTKHVTVGAAIFTFSDVWASTPREAPLFLGLLFLLSVSCDSLENEGARGKSIEFIISLVHLSGRPWRVGISIPRVQNPKLRLCQSRAREPGQWRGSAAALLASRPEGEGLPLSSTVSGSWEVPQHLLSGPTSNWIRRFSPEGCLSSATAIIRSQESPLKLDHILTSLCLEITEKQGIWNDFSFTREGAGGMEEGWAVEPHARKVVGAGPRPGEIN